MFVNRDRRISAKNFKLESAYQNFDEPALQLVPIGHWRLCPASGAWLAYMIALGRRNRPLQHRLIPRSYQTHYAPNTKLAPLSTYSDNIKSCLSQVTAQYAVILLINRSHYTELAARRSKQVRQHWQQTTQST